MKQTVLTLPVNQAKTRLFPASINNLLLLVILIPRFNGTNFLAVIAELTVALAS